MSTLIKGTVTLGEGRSERFVFGPRERILASRELGVKLTEDNISEEFFVFMIYASLKRATTIEPTCSFDEFIDQHLVDYEVDEDPK